jgi:hypothetical protein
MVCDFSSLMDLWAKKGCELLVVEIDSGIKGPGILAGHFYEEFATATVEPV